MVCRGSRGVNGGVLGVVECKEHVKKGRGIGGGMDVSEYVEHLTAIYVFKNYGRAENAYFTATIFSAP